MNTEQATTVGGAGRLFPAGVTEDHSPGKRITVVRLAEGDMREFLRSSIPLTIRSYFAPAYESMSRLERTFAAAVDGALPGARAKRTRSGDLGEILGAEFIRSTTSFEVIFRLRWKDRASLAMRGDDLIGVRLTSGRRARPRYLKGEAKSGVRPGASVIAAAREALDKDNGLPNPSTKGFIQTRLWEEDHESLLAAAMRADVTVKLSRVEHLLFILSGVDLQKGLRSDMDTASSKTGQHSVLVHIPNHANFVASVYEGVIADAGR